MDLFSSGFESRSANCANSRTGKRGLSGIALLMLVILTVPGIGHTQTNAKHFFWAPGQPNTPNPSSLASDLIYHGGNAGPGAIGVENRPATYLSLRGPDGATRVTTCDARREASS